MDAGHKRELEQKVRSGERLTREDGHALYASDDLAWLGGLAHEVRTRENGDVVHFHVGRHLDMRDICAPSSSCAYCSSRREPGGDDDAYTRHVDQAVRLAKRMAAGQPTELHIVNSLRPGLPWPSYPRSLKALKEALPQVSLKAFTATEIHHFEKISGLPASEILDELVDAGLDSLAGGGAEIFDEEVREQIVDHDTHWEDWSRIHRLAHAKGVRTPCTMLYGHIEEPRHRVDHLLRLRELQDETGGFQVFVPLLFLGLEDSGGAAGRPESDDTRDDRIRSILKGRAATATGAEALKTFAVSRLLFDNVPHVRVLWPAHGVRTAQLALQYGADDMGGPVRTVGPLVVSGSARDADGGGAPAPDELTREDLLDLVRDAGFRPVERNARYEVVRAYEGADPGRRDAPQPMRV